jgi:hypothetical protein
MARYRVVRVTRSDEFSYQVSDSVEASNADGAINRVSMPYNPATDVLIAFVATPSGVAMALNPYIEEAYRTAIEALETAGQSAMAERLRAMPPIDSEAIQRSVSDVQLELSQAQALTSELFRVLLPAGAWATLATDLARKTRSNAQVRKE